MQSREFVVKREEYVSDVRPDIVGSTSFDADTILWADANPIAYKIVTGHRSMPFGKASSTYIGWAQGSDSNSAVLHRLRTLKLAIDETTIFGWRARFTMDHYDDKGFRGALFQQFDGKYDRGCMLLDYTTGTVDEVVKRFLEWCDAGHRFPTQSVKLVVKGKLVRTIEVGR
jgi:hypothetical protein